MPLKWQYLRTISIWELIRKRIFSRLTMSVWKYAPEWKQESLATRYMLNRFDRNIKEIIPMELTWDMVNTREKKRHLISGNKMTMWRIRSIRRSYPRFLPFPPKYVYKASAESINPKIVRMRICRY